MEAKPTVDEEVTAGLAQHFDDFQQRVGRGARRLGFKIAFNPKPLQQQLGIPYSLVAGLTADTLAVDRTHRLSDATRPALEAEVSVRLGADLISDQDAPAAAAAIAALCPAIEVVDFDRPPTELQVVLARGVYHRAVVFGLESATPDFQNLRGVRARVEHNGAQIADVDAEEATGALPALLLHIARVLEPFGLHLQAGDRLILGSMAPPVFPKPGDDFSLALDGFDPLKLELA